LLERKKGGRRDVYPPLRTILEKGGKKNVHFPLIWSRGRTETANIELDWKS